MDDWVRMSVREGRRVPLEPTEGVPEHLAPHLLSWVKKAISQIEDVHTGAKIARAVVLEFQLVSSSGRELTAVAVACALDEDTFIEIVDMVLAFATRFSRVKLVQELQEILWMGRSVFEVSDDGTTLQRRVTREEKETFRLATSPDDVASSELTKAWSALYGVAPNPSAAWQSCITAVEALLAPIASPDDTKPTLGKTIPELEGDKAKRFSFRLPSTSNQLDGVTTLAAALRLMVNNPDRHGGGRRRIPTVEEATNVVQLAVTVVGWLRSGALTRVE